MPADGFAIVSPNAQIGGGIRHQTGVACAHIVSTYRGVNVTRQQEQLILRLWRDWCRVWPEQYGHESLQVKDQGYDPVFDVLPSQVYKDFYVEVVRGHPTLKVLNIFEVMDTALNQIHAPEAAMVASKRSTTPAAATPAQVVDVQLTPPVTPPAGDSHREADTA